MFVTRLSPPVVSTAMVAATVRRILVSAAARVVRWTMLSNRRTYFLIMQVDIINILEVHNQLSVYLIPLNSSKTLLESTLDGGQHTPGWTWGSLSAAVTATV